VLRTERDAAGQPAALFSGHGRKSLVLVVNAQARAAGVESGMSAPQAVARCPALLIRAPQPAAEAEARAALLAVGFTLSPLIEDTAPGTCTADLRGLTTPPAPAATAAVAQLRDFGLPAAAGLAATPLLALYAAQAAALSTVEPVQPLVCEPTPAVERVVPNALSSANPQTSSLGTSCSTREKSFVNTAAHGVLAIHDAPAFLAPLPLAAAQPSPELAAILAGWGLRTLGDLTALPRDEIVRRFGAAGLALWRRATGGEPRPLHPVTPPQAFAASLDFEEEIETLEPLLFILRRFLDRLTLELRASQHVAAEIELTLQLEDDRRHARQFRLPEPTADADILFRALHTHLESLHTDAAIAGVALRLAPARPLVRQQGLFETGLRDPHGFAETLARISALAGADRVGTPHLLDTHRPDAVRLAAPAGFIPPIAPPPVHAPIGLPLRRYRPPLPARLEFAGGAPTYLWTEAFAGPIAELRGPWPSSGDWWQPDRRWARTEWDVALEGGGLYRLILSADEYLVEGEYD